MPLLCRPQMVRNGQRGAGSVLPLRRPRCAGHACSNSTGARQGALRHALCLTMELHTKARQHDPKHSQRRPRKTWGRWQLGHAGAALPSKATLCLLQDFVESRRQVLAVPPPAIAPLPFSACMPESETQTSETPVCCGFRCLQHVISISNSTGRETRARASCICNHLVCL